MDLLKGKWTKNLIIKACRRCSTLSNQTSSKACAAPSSLTKRKSWSCSTSTCKRKRNKTVQIAPFGCFAVYIGPEKQRFLVKTEFANHPLFKGLLEDAALEYGYKNDGPILLPCDVDLFYNVLAEIESSIVEDMNSSTNWSLIQIFFCPARRRHWNSRMYNKGCGGDYWLLSPSPVLN